MAYSYLTNYILRISEIYTLSVSVIFKLDITFNHLHIDDSFDTLLIPNQIVFKLLLHLISLRTYRDIHIPLYVYNYTYTLKRNRSFLWFNYSIVLISFIFCLDNYELPLLLQWLINSPLFCDDDFAVELNTDEVNFKTQMQK